MKYFILFLSIFSLMAHAKEQPNIIIIYADDLGYDSVSLYNPKIGNFSTPAMDQLALTGMRFTDMHSSCSVCSPSRYSLLTGQYSWRTSKKAKIVGQVEKSWIAPDRVTIAEMLKSKGYDTCMIGKWHLGWNWPTTDGGKPQQWKNVDFTKELPGGPIDHGFDYYFGDDVPNWPPFTWIENNKVLIPPTETMPKKTFAGVSTGPAAPNWEFEAVLPEYVKRVNAYFQSRKGNDKPFFLYYPLPSPHTPIAPHKDFLGKSGINTYVDFLMETDWAVGELVKDLKENGLYENTVIIFLSDNGTDVPKTNMGAIIEKGVYLQISLKGSKTTLWEGGHRSPAFISWPGHIKEGSVSDKLVVQTDIYATLAELVDYQILENNAEDSISLLPLLRGKEINEPIHDIVVHQDTLGAFAVRMGDWKLNLKSKGLYNLKNDLKETSNLAAQYPEKVAEISSYFETFKNK